MTLVKLLASCCRTKLSMLTRNFNIEALACIILKKNISVLEAFLKSFVKF